MKKAILLIFFLISLKVSAQQTFWTPGVPPGSTSFSPTFRFLGTDSLANFYFSNGNKWWLGYTAAQSNLRFLTKTNALSLYIQNQNLIDQIANERLRGTITINKPLFHGVIPHSVMNGDGFTASKLNADSTVNVSITGTANQLLINEGTQQVFGLQGNASGNHISSGAVITTFDDTIRSARVPVNSLDITNKIYVDGAITASSLTFNQGLTKSGSTVSWGSTTPLTGNVNINPAANKIEFKGNNTNDISNPQGLDVLFDNTDGGSTVSLRTYRNSATLVGQAGLNFQSGGGLPTSVSLQTIDNTDNSKLQGFSFDNESSPIVVTNSINKRAMQYADKYTLADSLSIPSFGQVDSLINSAVATAGSVTSITPGIGFTSHTPITNSGTMDVDTAHIRGGLLKSSDAVLTYLSKVSPIYTGTLNGPRQNVGDTTRNSLIYAMGTSITRGVNSSNVTQYDSTYLSKLGRAMGFRWTNRGLSGRFLEQPGAADSSGYSQRYSIPAPTSVKDIYEIELQVNDAYHDSTIYTPANYQIQLDSMVVAAHSKGWAYNRIWIHNTGYYNPVSGNPTSPNTVYRHSLFLAKDIAVATARGTLQSDNYAAMQTAVGIDPSLYDSNLLHPTNKGHTMIHVLDSTYLASVGITKVNFATNIQNVIGSQYFYGDVNGQQNLNARNDANISNNANITNDAIIGRNITVAGTGSIGTSLAVGTIATVTTRVASPQLVNVTSVSNSTINMTDNGITLTRNIADANAAVTSTQLNASSTGAIHVFKFGSTTRSVILPNGYWGFGTASPTAHLHLVGTLTASPWGSALAQDVLITAHTITDNTTTDGSTVTTANVSYFGIPTINAANSSTGITYTTANNVVIAGAPAITGTNAVATNSYSLNILAGGTRLGALAASQAVFTDANKQLVSNAITGSGSVVMSTSPTLVTPNLGTPSTLVATNATGTAAGLTAGNVTTNANLTGPITSVGNATTVTAASITNAMLANTFVDNSTNQSSLAGVKTWTGQHVFNSAVTASGGAASGVIVAPAITAAANSDVGVGLDVTPTYSGFGAITTTGSITPGSSYTNGTYNGVAVTDNTGNGFGATANVVVSGNAVASFTIVNGGNQYKTTATQSVLTVAAALIGGTGSGFTVPVTGVNLTSTVLEPIRVRVGLSNFITSNVMGANTMTMHYLTPGVNPSTSNYFFRTDGASTYFNAGLSSGTVFFRIGNSTAAAILPTTGNFGMTTLGTTPTDNGYKMDIQAAGTTGVFHAGNFSVDASSVPTFALGSKIAITEGTNGRVGQVALVAGTIAVSITGVTTSSRAFCTRVIAAGTTLTTGITAVCTSGTLTITADVAAGTINTADTSTYNYFILN